MTVIFEKHTINPPNIVHVPNNFIWATPQAMPFILHSDPGTPVDLTDYVMENSLSISFRVELDDPLNYISTSGNVDITNPGFRNAFQTLRLDDLIENVLIIKVLIDGSPEYVGIVDPKQSSYDKIKEVYHFYFYDLFSFVYNNLPEYLATVVVDGTRIGDLFPYYKELSMGDQYIPLDFFLRTYNSLGDSVETDLDIPFTVERQRVLSTQLGAIKINNFLDQVRNHYGAYVFIDGNGVINIVSRNRGRLNAGAVDISDDIIEEEYIDNYTLPAEYNAVRCSSIIDDPDGTTIIDHLIYYDGEVKHLFIYSNTNLSSFNYLDLRTQIPGGISALYLFPIRSVDELKEMYGDIVKPRTITKCKVNRVDLPILKRVIIKPYEGEPVEYIILNMEKLYEEGTSVLELMKK